MTKKRPKTNARAVRGARCHSLWLGLLTSVIFHVLPLSMGNGSSSRVPTPKTPTLAENLPTVRLIQLPKKNDDSPAAPASAPEPVLREAVKILPPATVFEKGTNPHTGDSNIKKISRKSLGKKGEAIKKDNTSSPSQGFLAIAAVREQITQAKKLRRELLRLSPKIFPDTHEETSGATPGPGCDKWYGGIGVTVNLIGTASELSSVAHGYPAWREGLEEGDVLITGGDIRGLPGTSLRVTVVRRSPGGVTVMFPLRLNREKICTG